MECPQCQADNREGSDYSRRVHGENKGREGYVPGDVSEGEPLRCQKQSFGGSLPFLARSSNASSYIPLKIIDMR